MGGGEGERPPGWAAFWFSGVAVAALESVAAVGVAAGAAKVGVATVVAEAAGHGGAVELAEVEAAAGIEGGDGVEGGLVVVGDADADLDAGDDVEEELAAHSHKGAGKVKILSRERLTTV